MNGAGDRWHDRTQNAAMLRRLRDSLAADGRVLVFLGAGLSFGAARIGGRERFDQLRYPRPYFDDHWHSSGYFDGLPLPSWAELMARMFEELEIGDAHERQSLRRFFHDQGPLDCAQLFAQTVGSQRYREFLQEQFDTGRHGFIRATPSHQALVELDLPLLFTTNFDELIEQAYLANGLALRVSATEEEFKAHLGQGSERHLVKLHGSIDRPDSIVLTRDDYAGSRLVRREMFAQLRSELAKTSFLFVGFSLNDPNFGILHDDIRFSFGMNTPVSYTVQAEQDSVKDRYLSSLGVNTIWIDDWNNLPDFLRRIGPTNDPIARPGRYRDRT